MLAVLGSLAAAIWISYTQENRDVRLALTLAIATAGIFAALLASILVLRHFFRPYREIVGEIERLPIATRSVDSANESNFILATLQSVVSRLQTQQEELGQLNLKIKERAASAELLNSQIVGSIPSGLIAFDKDLLITTINEHAEKILEPGEGILGSHASQVLKTCPSLLAFVEESATKGKVFQREEVTSEPAAGPDPSTSTVAVAPATSSLRAVRSSAIRTGTRCASRTQLKVGLTFASRVAPELRSRSSMPAAMPSTLPRSK